MYTAWYTGALRGTQTSTSAYNLSGEGAESLRGYIDRSKVVLLLL
jgi:hypothetical protein